MRTTIAHALAALALGALPAAFQEQAPQPPQAGGRDLQQEVIELVQRVERRLIDIDRRLGDASAGASALEGVPDSGIDDLLRSAASDGQRTLEDIDRILELAQQMGGQQKGGGGQQSEEPQGGESPLDAERDRGPQERENTPSEPPGAEEPGEAEQDQGQEPNEQGQDPRDGERPDEPGGENREGRPQGSGPAGEASAADDANRWGELPVRYREVFRNQGSDDLPVQYREWIDAYHRRLSKTRR